MTDLAETKRLRLRRVILACEEVILNYEAGVPNKDFTPVEQAQQVANARQTIKRMKEELKCLPNQLPE